MDRIALGDQSFGRPGRLAYRQLSTMNLEHGNLFLSCYRPSLPEHNESEGPEPRPPDCCLDYAHLQSGTIVEDVSELVAILPLIDEIVSRRQNIKAKSTPSSSAKAIPDREGHRFQM